MKVYIITNDSVEKVYKKRSDAVKYLKSNGYKYRKGFYCLDGESVTEFDLMIDERQVIE